MNCTKRGSVFIVEGPDCTGKTTLCERLSKVFGYKLYHLTYYTDKEKMKQQFKDISVRIALGENLIIDRFILSNMAYGNVFHNGEYVEYADTYFSILSNQNVTLIMCLPEDKEEWLKRFKTSCEEREEMYPDLEKMSHVYDEFKMQLMLTENSCAVNNVIVYDFLKRDVE